MRSLLVVAAVLFLVGAAATAWGVTDSDCRWHSEDVQVCSGTGTGLVVAVGGGVSVGAGITLAVISAVTKSEDD